MGPRVYARQISITQFIPIVGQLYFGLMGNRLGYKKNGAVSVAEFITIQKKWNYWRKLYFWFLIVCIGILAIFVDAPEPLYKEGEQPFKN